MDATGWCWRGFPPEGVEKRPETELFHGFPLVSAPRPWLFDFVIGGEGPLHEASLTNRCISSGPGAPTFKGFMRGTDGHAKGRVGPG